MSDLRKVAQMALDALEYRDGDGADQWKTDVITALRAALAQPEETFCDTHCTWRDHHPDCDVARPEPGPEPVAYLWQHRETGRTRIIENDQVWTASSQWFCVGPLYTAPPQRKPLKEEEIDEIIYSMAGSDRANDRFTFVHAIDFARAIERAHGIGI